MERTEKIAVLAIVAVFVALLVGITVNRNRLAAPMVSEHVFDYPAAGQCSVVTYRAGYRDETMQVRMVPCNEIQPDGYERPGVLPLEH